MLLKTFQEFAVVFIYLWKTIACYRCWWIVGMGKPWHDIYLGEKKIFLFPNVAMDGVERAFVFEIESSQTSTQFVKRLFSRSIRELI